MPYYFSGTACRATATIVPFQVPASGYEYVRRARLYVNNVLVDSYDQVPGEPIPMSVSMAAMFDSTYFQHGTLCTVKAEYWDNLETYYHAESQSLIRNSALMAAYPEPEHYSARFFAEQCFAWPSFYPALMGGAWDPQQFVDAMNERSIIFVSTHGYYETFFAGKEWVGDITYTTYVKPSGPNTYILGYPAWLQSTSVEPNRIAQMGGGLPPYNTTQNPPITFAFIISCVTGATNAFSTFLHPYQNAYGGWCEDQAWTGFACELYLKEYEGISRVVFSRLSGGHTIAKAREKLIASDPPFTNASSDKPLVEDDMPIYGDTHTRVRSVYTGDDTAPIGWFRSL